MGEKVQTQVSGGDKERLEEVRDRHGFDSDYKALQRVIDRGLQSLEGEVSNSWLLYLTLAGMLLAGASNALYVLAEWPPRVVALFSIYMAVLFAMAYLIEVLYRGYRAGKWRRSS